MIRHVLERLRGRAVETVLCGALGGWLVVGAVEAARPLLAVPVCVGLVVALLSARAQPLPALVAAFAGLFLVDALGGGRRLEDPMLAAVIVACFLVGRWERPRRQPWVAAAVLMFLSLNALDPGASAGDVVFPTFFTAAPWLLGLVVQLSSHRADRATSYAAELTESRQEELRRATDEERLRIAHELHDIVAHHLSGVSLQAQVARRRVEAGHPVTAVELAALEEMARSAMTDLRRLLGVLRPADGEATTAPLAGLGDLGDLVERSRRSGQPVRLEVVGTPRELPPALSLVAFRIVQEALTNARRHGLPGAEVSVELDWREGLLVARIVNPCSREPLDSEHGMEGDDRPRAGSGAGHGLLGMTERARLFGGTVTTAAARGLWAVELRLPTPQPVREALT